ncbi:30S ribosomal protein S4e [Candidatus Bathyarchaeota archaeon]|nr:MAG: 30S ribosomal protein S4e [Candidatus Bathyarchaeota archaeon]
MHQKRLSAPKTLKIPRKVSKWVVKPSPGPHNKNALPLLILVRDLLKLADNAREARKIIAAGEILVDGVPRKNYKFPIGLFDVISIPKIGKNYRIIFDEKGRYIPIEIKDYNLKLYKIVNKTIVKGGKIQLNLFGGTNLLVTSNEFKTKDSLLLKIPEKEIVEHLKFENDALVMITGGTHAGEIGKIKEYRVIRSSAPNLVTVKGKKGEITTIEDYIFVIGKRGSNKPAINLGV